MRLEMPGQLATRYTNHAQQARVVSEAWAEANLYCIACSSPSLRPLAANTPTTDFTCPKCDSRFHLMSRSAPFSSRIVDAAYEKIREAIVEGRSPNLWALHYDADLWRVRNLILIPRFVFTLSCLERRKPLSRQARRRNWVGCNILLSGIAPDARISVVVEGVPAEPQTVRNRYHRLQPLEWLGHEARGWTLDVLNVLRGTGREEFTLADVYAHESALARLHPHKLHVRPKIRQQLQILRDLRFVEFVAPGRYRMT